MRRCMARPSDHFLLGEPLDLLFRKAEPIPIDLVIVLSHIAGGMAQLRGIDGEARNDIRHRHRAEITVGNAGREDRLAPEPSLCNFQGNSLFDDESIAAETGCL